MGEGQECVSYHANTHICMWELKLEVEPYMYVHVHLVKFQNKCLKFSYLATKGLTVLTLKLVQSL